MLRNTLVTTRLDAGIDQRDVQIAARHADPRTTLRYDREQELDRHPTYIHAAYMASGTGPDSPVVPMCVRCLYYLSPPDTMTLFPVEPTA